MNSYKTLRTVLRAIPFVTAILCTTDSSAQNNIPGLIHWWKANGSAHDSVGGGHGTLIGDISYTTGISDQGFLCNGGLVSIPSDPTLSFDPNSAVTFSLWAYRREGTDQTTVHLFAKRVGNGDSNYNFGGLGVQFGPANAWVHYTLVSDLGTTRFYQNGVYLGACDHCFMGPTNDAPLKIADSGTCNAPFFGIIDDLCIFNRALSASEVEHLYAAGLPKLNIVSQQNTVTLSWTNVSGFSLSSATDLGPSAIWTVSPKPLLVGDHYYFTDIISQPAKFFRLTSP